MIQWYAGEPAMEELVAEAKARPWSNDAADSKIVDPKSIYDRLAK